MPSHNFAKMRTDAHISTLQDYLEKRKTKGLGVPQAARRKGQVANAFISSETGIPTHVLEKQRVHKFILNYVEEIGYSEQVPDKWIITSARQPHYTLQVEGYLTRLKNEGKKVPEHPEKLGQPHLERIAFDCGIPLRAIRPSKNARAKLDEGIAELGIQVYATDPVWTRLTYGQLLEDGSRLRAEELADKAHANQQRYNTRHALRVWMSTLGLSEESFVGAELLGEFEETLAQVRPAVKSKTSKNKFSTEMRHWIDRYRELLRRKGLPADFRAALEIAIERSGLNAERVGELAGGCGGLLSGWLRGQALPSKASFPFVSRVEIVLKLEPGALISLIGHRRSKRFLLTDYPEFTVVGGMKIPLRNNNHLMSRLRLLLPDDFNRRTPGERQEMVNWLIANLVGPTSEWGFLNRELSRITYTLKEFPPVLEREWQELSEFKCSSFTPPGMRRGRRWSAATNAMRRSDFERIFGALSLSGDAEDHRLRGLGLSPSSFTLAMFICPKILHWWITWKGKRRCSPDTPERGHKFTHYEASLLFIIGGLFDKDTGWIRQRPDLAGHLKVVPGFIDKQLIRRAKSDWAGVCKEAFDYYMNFAEEIEKNAEIIRDSFEPILPILESESPMSALKTFAQNILDDMPDAGAAPVQAARAMRNYLIVRLFSATALRTKNIVELTYRSDNKGELRREKGKWVVEISYKRFKNKYSGFFGSGKKKHNFKKALEDTDGLYDRLEEYLNVHRQVLLRGTESDILLVARADSPQYDTHKFHIRYRALTMRYLAHNPYLGRGIEGVKPHGPHAVRDIVATHIIKRTGSYELAAYALCDSVQTVKEHYARFLPEDKLHLADKIMNEPWE